MLPEHQIALITPDCRSAPDRASFSADGVKFDGDGDYVTLPSFDYYSDSSFTISLWFTKAGDEGGQGCAPLRPPPLCAAASCCRP